MPWGVVVFDRQLRMTDSNRPAEVLLGREGDVAEALGAGTEQTAASGWRSQLEETLRSGQTSVFDNVAFARNGRSYTLRMACAPLAGEESGGLLGGILLLEDMTARRAMESELAGAERLAAVGKLAARVAHELNNPLDGILRYLNLSLRVAEKQGSESLAHYLRESRRGLLRMVQIVSELLEFSRSTYSAFQEADLNKIVEEAIRAFESQAAERGVSVVRRYGGDVPNVRSGNLFQVFCNLVKNAIDAMEGGGRLEVATRCDAHNVLIEFADTGPGIAEENKGRLFEPFFTTKAAGKGTGLGLAISKDIVERYNGQIRAENGAGGGATFTVAIPLEHAHPAGGQGGQFTTEAPRPQGRQDAP